MKIRLTILFILVFIASIGLACANKDVKVKETKQQETNKQTNTINYLAYSDSVGNGNVNVIRIDRHDYIFVNGGGIIHKIDCEYCLKIHAGY